MTTDQEKPECHCDLRTKLVGDGCAVCNPEYAEDHQDDKPEGLPEPVGHIHDPEGYSGNVYTEAQILAVMQERNAAIELAEDRLHQMTEDRKQALDWRDGLAEANKRIAELEALVKQACESEAYAWKNAAAIDKSRMEEMAKRDAAEAALMAAKNEAIAEAFDELIATFYWDADGTWYRHKIQELAQEYREGKR